MSDDNQVVADLPTELTHETMQVKVRDNNHTVIVFGETWQPGDNDYRNISIKPLAEYNPESPQQVGEAKPYTTIDENPLIPEEVTQIVGDMLSDNLLDLEEFQQLGLLQEVNRQFFHPLGLALVLSKNQDGTLSIHGIFDERDDPEGITFMDGTISQDMIEQVKALRESKQSKRIEVLGTVIQENPSQEDQDNKDEQSDQDNENDNPSEQSNEDDNHSE